MNKLDPKLNLYTLARKVEANTKKIENLNATIKGLEMWTVLAADIMKKDKETIRLLKTQVQKSDPYRFDLVPNTEEILVRECEKEES